MQASTPSDVLQAAADGVERLQKLLKKSSTAQVKSKEDTQIIRATALAWFNNHRKELVGTDASLFKAVEDHYTNLFQSTGHATLRSKYQQTIKALRAALLALQTHTLANTATGSLPASKPNFASLVADSRMRDILDNRWAEIVACLKGSAPLAATIMMGGLLEAFFLARVNKMPDKAPLFKASAAPKDPKTGKTRPLNEWMLGSYIDVGAELGWITKPAKDIGVVLRNYRNFVHPERELSTGTTLTPADATMFWSVCTQLVQQIIDKAAV